jgi:thiol-disulfide isomerase/thioredoxin
MPVLIRRSLGCLLLLAVPALVISSDSPGQGAKTTEVMPRLTYTQLVQLVHDHKGKVVYVDFWKLNCPPCKAGMVELARFQRKTGNKDLLVITVSLDDPANPQFTKDAIAFLEKKGLDLNALTNIQLNETPKFTEETLQITSVPRSYLFDREGRLVEKYTQGVDHDDLEKKISALLKK